MPRVIVLVWPVGCRRVRVGVELVVVMLVDRRHETHQARCEGWPHCMWTDLRW